MKRSAGPKRKTALAPGGTLPRKGSRPGRGAPIKPVNRKRAAANRKRNFGPEADAVERMPCLVWETLLRIEDFGQRYQLACLQEDGGKGSADCRGDVVAAHVTARGMGAAKGCCMDIVPLCSAHHEEAGENRTSQRAAFEARYGLDLRREADRIAVGHEPPLGIRGLAQSWAAVTTLDYTQRVAGLDRFELDALMGWVRREMERSCIAGVFAEAVRESGLAGEREVLAYCVGRKLGGPFEPGAGGWHSLALTLCEAAGWPS